MQIRRLPIGEGDSKGGDVMVNVWGMQNRKNAENKKGSRLLQRSSEATKKSEGRKMVSKDDGVVTMRMAFDDGHHGD